MATKPDAGYTTEFVTNGQCNARYTITFLDTPHNCRLVGNKLYWSVTEYTQGVNNMATELWYNSNPSRAQTCKLSIITLTP